MRQGKDEDQREAEGLLSEGGGGGGWREGREEGGIHRTIVGPVWELHVRRQRSSASGVRARRIATGVLACMCLAGVVLWIGREGEQGRSSELEGMNPSDTAANIIAGAEGFHRSVADFATEDPDTGNSAVEKNYAAVASAIVGHGQHILDHLLGKYPPPPPNPLIPMPKDDDDNDSSPPPPAHPAPQPNQGAVAAAIVEGSAKQRQQNLEAGAKGGALTPVRADVLTPTWTNAGAKPEDNVLAYPETYVPADSPDRKYPQGRNYFRTAGGESADAILGALGGGTLPGTSAGTGPRVNHYTDNGSMKGSNEGFSISTASDDIFHSAKPTWIPIQGPTSNEDSGAGLDDPAYLSVYGKAGPSNAPVQGPAITVRADTDNGAAGGDRFSFSTIADRFDCGDDCNRPRISLPASNATAA